MSLFKKTDQSLIKVNDGTKDFFVEQNNFKDVNKILDVSCIHEVNLHEGYVIEKYKEFLFKIQNFRGMFCGYVLVRDHPQKDLIDSLRKDDCLYDPHGGYTAYFGFDCGHYGDTIFKFSNGEIEQQGANSSYKSYSYAKNECIKIIDSILSNLDD